MNLYNVLLNNKIPFVLHESSDSENVIYCKSFSDYLFNVGTFTTRTKEVILEYVVNNAEKYVVADVTFDNGECYRNVRFKVVVNENTETPYSTINLNLLNNKTRVAVPQKSQQIIEDVEEVVEEPAPVYISAPIIEAPDYTETINETLKLQKKLNVEKEEIKKQKILLEKQDTIKRKLSEYKQELLEDYFNATKKQTELLENNIQENITTAEYELNQRLTNTFNDFNLQLEEFKDRTKQEQIQLIVKQLGETAASIKLEITDIISNKFNSEHEQVVDLLYEKTKLLEETYQRKLIFELEQYKEKLFEEYRVFSSDTVEQVLKAKTDVTYQSIDEIFHNRQAEIKEYYDNRLIESRQEIDNFAAEIKTFSTHLTELEKAFLESEEKFKNTLTEKEKIFAESLEQKIANSKAEFGSIIAEFTKRLPGITSNINTLETKVKTLIEEKAKSFKEDFSTTQQDYIAKTAQYWAKRILDLGGGGGSVATQYANGGTMNGDLNVNANYLSGGVNLLDIFVTSDSDSQTLSFNESNAQLSISNGNTVSLSALSGEFTDRLVRGSYQVVLSGDGNLTVPGAIVTTSNSKLDLVGFGPNTAYLTTTNDDSTALFMGLASAELYAQTYVQIRANTGGISQNWTFGADGSLTFPDNTTQTTAFTGIPSNIAYTNQDTIFEKNVTIQGNLTALGTSTFKNTIFTTTSALSVYNTGPGPALYVFQAAGPYDVASFYDGDGIEVLHVGNAQGGGNPLGQVGINTSFPSAELTVNGAISSNGVITVLDGNSNKWNSNWTTTNTNSANYILQNGNSFGSAMVIGTNDSQSISVRTNGIQRLLITNSDHRFNGNVGIGTSGAPSERLTVNGNISANSTITASGGNSNQWNSNYSTTQSNSANWSDVFTTVRNFSATWEESADIGAVADRVTNIQQITGSWQRTYANVSTNSANWDTAYTNLVSNSSNYLSGASVSYVNTNFVKLSGDVMTGGLSATGLSSAFVQILNNNTGAPALNPKLFILDNSGIGYPELFTVQAADVSDPLLRFKRTASNAGNYVFMVRGAPGATWMSINDNSYFDQQLIIHSNGNVGINQTAPATKLHVNGVITATGGNSNQWNTAYTNLVSNSSNYLSGVSVSYVNTNFVKLSGDTMTGSLTVTGNISASAIGYFNHVAAATKSFYIQHPTKPGMHLQYGSLESPYHGVRLTGSGSVKSGDSVVVPLPDYIFSLVHQEGVNIQLTNYQHNKTLFVDDIDVSNNTFTVKCEKKLFDKGEYKFFWSFTAIRKDIPHLQVEC